jgi:hypothetical protein
LKSVNLDDICSTLKMSKTLSADMSKSGWEAQCGPGDAPRNQNPPVFRNARGCIEKHNLVVTATPTDKTAKSAKDPAHQNNPYCSSDCGLSG